MSFSAIIKLGKYYNPANLHYSPTTQVVCDRCQKDDIPVCIGYQDQDLCLACADYVSNTMYVKIPRPVKPIRPVRPDMLTLMMSSRFEEPLSRMVTDRFIGGRDERLTYMMSDRFNVGDNCNNNNSSDDESSDEVLPLITQSSSNPRPRVLTKMMTKRFNASPKDKSKK